MKNSEKNYMRKKYFFTLSIALALMMFTACSRLDLISDHGNRGIASDNVPNSFAFKGWVEKRHLNTSNLEISEMNIIPLSCENEYLAPTHPQMTTKLYHSTKIGQYDHFRLNANDEACTIGGKFKNKNGQLPCMKADYLTETFISDTYQDQCGNFYRGIHKVVFFKTHENIATLFSPGKVMIQNPKSTFDNDYILEGTYLVHKNDFYFLTNLFEDDLEKIKISISQSEKMGFKKNIETGLFKR
ncbi:MAG: hypothetical protein M9962_00700 [Oligoflexia bacterium]|nr:hypothetical protein [Oligoflexia bacterium]